MEFGNRDSRVLSKHLVDEFKTHEDISPQAPVPRLSVGVVSQITRKARHPRGLSEQNGHQPSRQRIA